MSRFLKWIESETNRDLVKMAAACVATLVAAGWAVMTYATKLPLAPSVSAKDGGIAAGRDVFIDRKAH